ncbi:YeeE/YedE family protein [Elioraea sp.]|uniref:YeeE/YedE family protein n=1 Tax=Elioraea sp. TaxID=2185103 RepID=UPI003F6E51B2
MILATAVHRSAASLLGLLLGTAGVTAVLVLLPAGDAALLPLFAVALVLGAAFVVTEFGFTAGFRDLLVHGDGRSLAATLIVPAVAAIVIVPMAMLGESHGRYVAPIGLPLVVGAAIFGIGMQMTSGCGSGTLVAAGAGSRRMLVALPFFSGGGVLGSLAVPHVATWPGLGAVDLAATFGATGGLVVTEAIILGSALLIARGQRPAPTVARAAVLIGALAAMIFLVSGLPWGVTMGLTVAGAKAVQLTGVDLGGSAFWAWEGARSALDGPLLAHHSALSNIGLLLGALLAAAVTGRLRHDLAIGWNGTIGAAVGGVLMGIGARLSFGCNIGAVVGGLSSGSLHGLAWLIAAMPGCWLGIRLRPLLGMRTG